MGDCRDLAFGKDVTLQTHGYDKYKRTLADVILPDGTHINHSLVKDGWCWWHRKYAPKDLTLKQYEETAKAEKKGIWADKDPMPPWVFWRLRSVSLSEIVPAGRARGCPFAHWRPGMKLPEIPERQESARLIPHRVTGYRIIFNEQPPNAA